MKTFPLALIFVFVLFFSCQGKQTKSIELSEIPIEIPVELPIESVQTIPEEDLEIDLCKKLIPITIVANENLVKDVDIFINNVLRHSCVSKEEAKRIKSNNSKFINEDESLVSIEANKITLPCRDTTVVYEDWVEDDYYGNYSYEGKIEVLNSYIVHANLLEVDYDYIIDIENGKKEYPDFFSNTVIFSPKGDYIVEAGFEPIEWGTTYINIYKIENKKLKALVSLEYRDCMPQYRFNDNVGVWDDDNNIYIPMATDARNHEPNQENEYTRYLKLGFDAENLLPYL